MTLPTCAERVEIDGQHTRYGSRLVFDHSFDPPWAVTEFSLTRDGMTETIRAPHLRPDGGRLLAATLTGIVGAGLLIVAGYETGVNGRALTDDGPFYAGVFGTLAAGTSVLLGLTGWQPVLPAEVRNYCGAND